MRNVVPILLVVLAGCGLRGGRGTARWNVDGEAGKLSAPATGQWCPSSRTLVVQATDEDRVVGFVWHYDSLRPDSAVIAPPPPVDSPATGASAALRMMKDGELFGFRSVSGILRVTAVDTLQIDARLEAKLQRVGRTDSTGLTAEFRRVALVRDTTLCRP